MDVVKADLRRANHRLTLGMFVVSREDARYRKVSADIVSIQEEIEAICDKMCVSEDVMYERVVKRGSIVCPDPLNTALCMRLHALILRKRLLGGYIRKRSYHMSMFTDALVRARESVRACDV